MAIKHHYFYILLLFFYGYGCAPVQHISKTDVSYTSVHQQPEGISGAAIAQMIAPYKAQLDDQMNEVLAVVTTEMTKKKPESSLGNWYCDAMMAYAKSNGYEADLAISNYGGLRVPYIMAGPLTRGEIYELSPFDNLTVIVDVPGNILDTIFQQIASTEGWPISADVRMQITNKQVSSCTINGSPIIADKIYKVIMPDYVANGGDELRLLIPLSRFQTGKLCRDILIEHAIETARLGKKVSAPVEGRIIIKS
jgi:2',3'-cyclic-nucleotide 2'-phosphodiesterase (5'-nucleotidase family)